MPTHEPLASGVLEALAPGKLILSGEHAVVHGAPALITAIDRYARATILSTTNPGVRIDWPDRKETSALSWDELAELRRACDARYAEFEAGRRSISGVLAGPLELVAYALASYRSQGAGLTLTVTSDIPIGCGMGSSAAIAAAVLKAATSQAGIEVTHEELYTQALRAERLQHGRPSGADPYTCIHGGCIRFRHGRAERQLPIADLSLRLVHTGRPVSSTGESVMAVSDRFGRSDIWSQFADITNAFERAWRDENRAALMEQIRRNHELLCRIGVVPEPVQRFISEIEAAGGAAKVCGAGAVDGVAAGVVLVMGDVPDVLLQREGRALLSVRPDLGGVRLAST